MRIHYLQHVPFEGLGSIEPWAGSRGHAVTATRMYTADPQPGPEAFDWLIVMGGPMGVYDDAQYPWLTTEKRLIERAIAQGKTVLGICLGAQLIAHVLGARVYPNAHKEIGWHPIERTAQAIQTPIGRTLPERAEVFHWHGDTFDLPAGASHLATSPACRQQAFLHGDRVLGLQFHLETTPAGAADLIRHGRHELLAGSYIQQPDAMTGDPRRFEQINLLMRSVLEVLAGGVS